MGYVQIAMEESPRYEGAATSTPFRISTAVRYPAITEFTSAPGPDMLERGDEMRNIEGQIPNLPNAFAPDFGWTQRMYANDLPWLLTLNGWIGVWTAGAASGVLDPDGINHPVGTNRWVFTKRGGRTAKTAQLIQGITENAVFIKHQGGAINELSMNAGGELGISGSSLVWDPIADPALTPVFDAGSIVPMRRADVQIMTWLAGTGENDDFTVAITNPTEVRKSFMTSFRSYFPDKHFHAAEKVAVRGTIPKYSVDPEDLEAILSGSTFAAKVRWKSDKLIGATAKEYAVWLELAAAQYTGGGPGPQGNVRNVGAALDWNAGWDEAAGYDAKITISNAVTAVQLETLA